MELKNAVKLIFFLPVRRLLARYLISKDGWLAGCLSHASIVSKQLNLS